MLTTLFLTVLVIDMKGLWIPRYILLWPNSALQKH